MKSLEASKTFGSTSLPSHRITNKSLSSGKGLPISVLLVEDVISDQQLITYYLQEVKQQEYQIHLASKLEDGLAILKSKAVDIVLLDLHLPDSSGLSTFEQINDLFRDLPIIILTGAVKDEQLAMIALETGAQDYLQKDELSSSILKKSIQYALKRKELTHGLESAQRMGKLGFWKLNPLTMEWQGAPNLNQMLGRTYQNPVRSLAEFLKMVDIRDRDRVRQSFKEAILSKGQFELIHKIDPHKGGQGPMLFSLQGKAVLDAAGELLYMEGTAQDISERLRLEDALQQKELAQKEAYMRQEFLAKTSHEIRTPLNPILVLTDLLMESKLTEEQIKHITNIRYAANTLLALVNDILDLSKIEAGQIDFSDEVFSLLDLFSHIEELLSSSAEKKSLELDFLIEQDVANQFNLLSGDAVRLTQILINLNTNAIKFTHQGSVTNKIRLMHMERDRVWLEFSVKDTGIGIPEDQLQEIFESFKQVDTLENRSQKGTGLGLTIVRQLVNLQGGRLRVDSSLGKGSTFYVEMPFKIAPVEATPIHTAFPSPPTSPEKKVERNLKGLKVLLVEDDPLNQLVTEKLLEKWRAGVDIANNGEEGIEMLQEGNYDLVLMDVQMPVMNGLEATQKIRSMKSAPFFNIPIIALTANTISGSDDECFKVGMNDYVSKPIETENFYRKLVTYVGHSSGDNAVRERPLASNLSEIEQPDVSKGISTYTPMADHRYTDLSGLKDIYGGDTMLVEKTVKTIVKKVPEYLDDMNNFHVEGNLIKVAEMIHKLKANVVGYMGISEFSEGELDQVINKIKNSEFPKEKVDEFLEKFNTVVKTGIEELRNDLQNS